jgi:prepilin-type N-terminal cleavage/methylation domain-containing protein
MRTNRPPATDCIHPSAQSDAGFTLIEVLVASALSVILFGAVLAALENSQRLQARDTEWALTLQEGRAGLARMAREVRQASKVEKAEAGTILFLATINSKNWQIKYECGVAQSGTTYYECVRFAAEEGKSLPSKGTPIVRNVTNGTTVFSYSPSASPNVVTMKVELPAKGTLKQAGSSAYSHTVALENSAFMRNLDLSG